MSNSLKQRLSQDLKKALYQRDKEKISLLRYLLAEIHNKEIEKEGKQELTNEEIIELLRKGIRKREESIRLFRQGNRQDLAEKEEKEIALISSYLPPLMSREEIEKLVKELIQEGFSEFGSLMKEAMHRLRGRAEGKKVSEVVRSLLEELRTR